MMADPQPEFLPSWGWSRSPFADNALFRTPAVDEALARLHYLVRQRRSLGILLGGSGSGKSRVLAELAREQRTEGAWVLSFSLLARDENDFLHAIAGETMPADNRLNAWRRALDRLAMNRFQRIPSVLLLDDADEAPRATLQAATRLLQEPRHEEGPVSMVLACTTSRVAQIGRRLMARGDLRVELAPWEESEVAAWIRRCLEGVGEQQERFPRETLDRLHALTAGQPRFVRRLAESAALAAAESGRTHVDTATLEACWIEWGSAALDEAAGTATGSHHRLARGL